MIGVPTQQGIATARGRRRTGWIARTARRTTAVFAVALLAVVGITAVDAQPAIAAPQGCGYANGTANNGEFASTICWFDFTDFDIAEARSVTGQAMQVTLDGGYVANFTVRFSDVAGTVPMNVERRSTPLETRFAFGSDAYRGIAGLHSLYSLGSPAGLKGGNLSFEDIQIVDALGAPVSGFSFVAADTEDNVAGESFAWSSDRPLTEIERLAPNGNWGCKAPVGLGTTNVTCAGTGAGGTTTAGGKSTALLVAADSPTRFATQWITGARSGIAIGIQTAKVTLVKTVSGRIDAADSFDITVAGAAGSTVGSATTGSSDSASTGSLNVLAGGSFTLSETGTASSPTNLANYTPSWACTNTSATSTTDLPSGTGTSQTLTPLAGDDITCTITNTAKSTAISLQKAADAPVDVNGNGITDIGDTIAYSFVVTNSGDASLENISVSDPKAGTVVCPGGTVAPGAFVTCNAAAAYTVTAADANLGAVNNTATATGSPLGSAAIVTSAPSSISTPVGTPLPELTLVKSASPSSPAAFTVGQVVTYSFVVTNSGNVPLSDVAVTDIDFSGTGTLSPISCPSGDPLLAGEQTTCTATYTLTQADVDSGSVSNTATATGQPTAWPNPISSNDSSFTIPVDPAPALTLVKTVDSATAQAGDSVTYSFAVTNSGNVSVSGTSITETAFSGTGTRPSPVCPAAALLPGARVICTADYTITAADARAGSISNAATATATAPTGAVDPVSAASTATLAVAATAAPVPLASTGSTAFWGGIPLAVLLLASGGVLVVIRRWRARRQPDPRQL